MYYSICITYFYKRNNIISLLKELKKYKKKKIEIIVRNDNPKHILRLDNKICKNHKLIIINEKKKSIGEIESIKYLLKKSTGKIISIIADDDLLLKNCFDEIDKIKHYFDCVVFPVTFDKKNLRKKIFHNTLSQIEMLNLFFKRKLNLSGTIATFYESNFLNRTFNKLKNKKYNLDTILTIKYLLEKKCIFINKINGFNNIKTSKISSGDINLKTFYYDNKLILNYLKNKKKNNLYLLYVILYLQNFYSVIFRNFKIKNFKYTNLFFKNLFIKNKIILNIKILFYIIKTKILITLRVILNLLGI